MGVISICGEFDGTEWNHLRVLDGGFGTGLDDFGFCLAADPLWSAAALIDRPDLVVEVHKQFIQAGCDVILTNSYHANIKRMISGRGMTKDEAVNVVKKSVELALQAVSESQGSCKRPVEIIGSVGSYSTALCDCSEYNGHYVDEVEQRVIAEHHIEQSLPLLDAGLKTLAYETIPAVQEVQAVLVALDELPGDFKCYISLTCKDQEHTAHSDSFMEAAKLALNHPKVFGIGINCTSPAFIAPLLSKIQGFLGDKVAIVYPNSGEIYEADSKSWSGSAEWSFTEAQIKEWKNLGVKLVGGCCRVNSKMIRSIAEKVNKLKNL